jgi:hypothetical protein
LSDVVGFHDILSVLGGLISGYSGEIFYGFYEFITGQGLFCKACGPASIRNLPTFASARRVPPTMVRWQSSSPDRPFGRLVDLDCSTCEFRNGHQQMKGCRSRYDNWLEGPAIFLKQWHTRD